MNCIHEFGFNKVLIAYHHLNGDGKKLTDILALKNGK